MRVRDQGVLGLRDCQECWRPVTHSRFDATFQTPDDSERLVFDLPGALCSPCRLLYVDRQVVCSRELGGSRLKFVIESSGARPTTTRRPPA